MIELMMGFLITGSRKTNSSMAIHAYRPAIIKKPK
jgi:hypothetical protein